jgi:hypothetical protein
MSAAPRGHHKGAGFRIWILPLLSSDVLTLSHESKQFSL